MTKTFCDSCGKQIDLQNAGEQGWAHLGPVHGGKMLYLQFCGECAEEIQRALQAGVKLTFPAIAKPTPGSDGD